MNNIVPVIKICQVVSVDDDTDGDRIKARLLPEDRNLPNSEIPYAFPLLPKILHIKPKVGEAVIIITSDANNNNTDRFYIGPIISQPQFIYKNDYDYGALTLLKGAITTPSVAPSTNPNTKGALPNKDDIAICGRNNSDIILSDNDIKIRCGAHLLNDSNKSEIAFNKKDPAYFKIKYHTTTLNNESKSTATIVADEINLLSNKIGEYNLTNSDDLISDDEMNKILSSAHLLPYGDKLIEFLKIFVTAFKTHTHPYPNMPPVPESTYQAVDEYNLNDILSKNIRIS